VIGQYLAAETVGKPALNIAIFLVFIAATLVVVFVVGRSNRTAADYYAAGRPSPAPRTG
jgi:cation/acetate symporter